ncbi:MAG: hypothetical protein QF632_01805 [Candidatus Woesearchaeota archaeon]|jgi:plastocyanin|nr:hypothetical protein [Candidatus Woesearchaeota archaeon]MDP7323476.1 hypothetical protein [Candidatus Woesearchaeota archaeon]MDP7457578.1 hypothetical protein [Candidatus Woesearchaeota archaeon]
MPTLLKKHHASRFHFAMFAIFLVLIVLIVSYPTSNDAVDAQEQYPQKFVQLTENPEQSTNGQDSVNLESTTEPVQTDTLDESLIALTKKRAPAPDQEVVVIDETNVGLDKTDSSLLELAEDRLVSQESLVLNKNSVNIDITWGSFSPEKIQVKRGTKVTWTHSDDSKKFLIACYLGPNRILKSENLFPGESFSYTFTEDNEYLCIDAIYGARGFITVGNKKPGNAITGGIVNIDNLQGSTSGMSLKVSLDPLRRLLANPISLNAFATIALILMVVSTLEYSIHLD